MPTQNSSIFKKYSVSSKLAIGAGLLVGAGALFSGGALPVVGMFAYMFGSMCGITLSGSLLAEYLASKKSSSQSYRVFIQIICVLSHQKGQYLMYCIFLMQVALLA